MNGLTNLSSYDFTEDTVTQKIVHSGARMVLLEGYPKDALVFRKMLFFRRDRFIEEATCLKITNIKRAKFTGYTGTYSAL